MTNTTTTTTAATIESLQSVPAGQGDHYFFLNHLATVKVVAGGSDSGLALVEFLAPRGFGPPLHAHTEEDELMYVLEGQIRIDLVGGDSTTVSAGAVVTLPHGVPHVWQVVSDVARFLTVNAGRRNAPSFDHFVAALGTPTDPRAVPDRIEINPGHVAQVCAEHGIEVLGPPPPTLDQHTSVERPKRRRAKMLAARPSAEAGRSCAWRIDDIRRGVGIRDEDLTFEAVRVDEEHRKHRAEVGDEVIGGAAGHQAPSDLLERFERSCLEPHMVEATPTEHRRLALCLIVAVDLENVQHASIADIDEREFETNLLLDRARRSSVKDLRVETRQAFRVSGEHGHVVDAIQQHGSTLR